MRLGKATVSPKSRDKPDKRHLCGFPLRQAHFDVS